MCGVYCRHLLQISHTTGGILTKKGVGGMSDEVKKEYEKLKRLFKTIPSEQLKVVDGMILQAARLKVGLDEAWEDIEANGEYDLFQNSKDLPSMERERPIAKIFTSRHGAYHKTILDLVKLLPNDDVKEEVKRKSLI